MITRGATSRFVVVRIGSPHTHTVSSPISHNNTNTHTQGRAVGKRFMSGNRKPMRFDRLIDRSEDNSLKWSRYEKDVIPMWVADMDFRSPEPIVRAVTARARTGVYGYAAPSDRLKRAIVNRLNMVYGSPNENAKEEWICWLPGLVSGLSHSVRAFVPYDETAISYVNVESIALSLSLSHTRLLTKMPQVHTDLSPVSQGSGY